MLDKWHFFIQNSVMINENRIINIETKLAYLEDFVNRLQEILVEHSSALEVLKAENICLKNRLSEIHDSLEEMPQSRPPHY